MRQGSQFLTFVAVASVMTFLAAVQLGAAPKEISGPPPADLRSIIFMAGFGQIATTPAWSLHFEFHDQKYKAISTEEALALYRALVSEPPGEPKKHEGRREYGLRRQYKAEAETFFQSAPKIAGNTIPVYLSRPDSPALRFAEKAGTLCVFVPSVGVDKVFNTLRSDDRTRAWMIASSISVPFLKALATAFEKSEIPCLGVGVAYGSKNLADLDAILNLKTEYLALFAIKKDVLAFSEGVLTEEDLLEKADAFVKTRDMAAGVKKIRLTVPR
jgi:hypothetical protein